MLAAALGHAQSAWNPLGPCEPEEGKDAFHKLGLPNAGLVVWPGRNRLLQLLGKGTKLAARGFNKLSSGINFACELPASIGRMLRIDYCCPQLIKHVLITD